MDEGRKLTDQEIEQLNDVLSEEKPLEIPEYEAEEGYMKTAEVLIDPETGENKVIGTLQDGDKEFNDMLDKIDSGDITLGDDNAPITEDELKKSIQDDPNFNISDEAVQKLLIVANRKLKNEKFNIYRELPDEVKTMVDGFMQEAGLNPRMANNAAANQFRAMRNDIAENLVDQFISNIQMSRAQIDLNNEIDNIFKNTSKEIAEYAIGYTEERNAKCREYAETMEDQEKKKKLLEVLDIIDEAYNLDSLKKFALNCKIKNYDIEDPRRLFDSFLAKYKNSNYNIYDIKLTIPILVKRLAEEDVDEACVIAFLVAFCKQVMNYTVSNPIEHTYMYYFIYNIILINTNNSEKTKHVSDKFVENIKEVISNLKQRNPKLN